MFIPATLPTAPNVNVLPSTEISVILLKTISPFVKLSPLWYAIIASVWIPTNAAKLRLLTVAVLPVIFNWSVIENPSTTRSCNTVSALKSDSKSEFSASASWNTDFISSTV